MKSKNYKLKYKLQIFYDGSNRESEHIGLSIKEVDIVVEAFRNRGILLMDRETDSFGIDFSKVSYIAYEILNE